MSYRAIQSEIVGPNQELEDNGGGYERDNVSIE